MTLLVGGITASYVTKILRGETKRPSAEKLHSLATGLDEPDTDIFQAAGVPLVEAQEWTAKSAARALDRIVSVPELSEIVRVLLDQKPEALKSLLPLIQRFLKKRSAHH